MKCVLTFLLLAAPLSAAIADDAKSPVKQAPAGTQFVPLVKDGKPYGVKMYAIQLGSRHAKQGFRNGDTLIAIDGHLLTDRATEPVFRALLIDGARGGKVDLDRAGKRMTLTIELVHGSKK